MDPPLVVVVVILAIVAGTCCGVWLERRRQDQLFRRIKGNVEAEISREEGGSGGT